MKPGRRPKGVGHVDKLDGGEQEKRRLKAILASLTGLATVAEASRGLGIRPSRFARLRDLALQGALDRLAPHPVGRPAEQEDDMEPLKREGAQRKERQEAERMVLQTLFQMGQDILGERLEKRGFPAQGARGRRGSGSP